MFADWRVLLVVTGASVRDARMDVFRNIVEAGGKAVVEVEVVGYSAGCRFSQFCRGDFEEARLS